MKQNKLTFDQLPGAVAQLFNKMDNIERLLLSQSKREQLDIDKLLTVQEAAKHLNLAVPTVYALVSRNEIPFAKKSKRLYFNRQDLTSYILSGKRKTNSEIAEEAIKGLGSKKKGVHHA